MREAIRRHQRDPQRPRGNYGRCVGRLTLLKAVERPARALGDEEAMSRELIDRSARCLHHCRVVRLLALSVHLFTRNLDKLAMEQVERRRRRFELEAALGQARQPGHQ